MVPGAASGLNNAVGVLLALMLVSAFFLNVVFLSLPRHFRGWSLTVIPVRDILAHHFTSKLLDHLALREPRLIKR